MTNLGEDEVLVLCEACSDVAIFIKGREPKHHVCKMCKLVAHVAELEEKLGAQIARWAGMRSALEYEQRNGTAPQLIEYLLQEMVRLEWGKTAESVRLVARAPGEDRR